MAQIIENIDNNKIEKVGYEFDREFYGEFNNTIGISFDPIFDEMSNRLPQGAKFNRGSAARAKKCDFRE